MKSLLAVFVFSTLLRSFQLTSTPAGVYWDEMDTGYQAYSLLLTGRDYFGNLFPAHLQSFADYRSGLYIYLTVPFVKLFGLTALSIRLPAVLFSLISAIASWIFARRILKMAKYAWIMPLIIITSPWTLIQGRVVAESQLLISLLLLFTTAFFMQRYNLAAILLGLSLWAYPTAKVFIPILGMIVWISNRAQLNYHHLLKALIVFSLIGAIPIIETFTKPLNRRFLEVSVFTDPTVAKQIEIGRQESYLGRGGEYRLGLETQAWDKLAINKFSFWANKIINNYLTSLSTNFLFISGDPNIRHNLQQINVGQFYAVLIWPFILGLISYRFKFLIWWMLMAPLPAALTRDGSTHAPRLIFLLIPLASFISLGIKHMLLNHKIQFKVFSLFYLVSLISAVSYFFSAYRVKSAAAFNYGFTQAVGVALKEKSHYERVILDGANESLLMAYLFVSGYPPKIIQKSFPLPSEAIANGVEGFKFDNVVILYPGTRDWQDIDLQRKSLLVVSSSQNHASNLPIKFSINYPDHTSAFIITERNPL